jgi:hypothetical protein
VYQVITVNAKLRETSGGFALYRYNRRSMLRWLIAPNCLVNGQIGFLSFLFDKIAPSF